MGHIIFVILHLIALIFGWVFLLITIPMHLIYSAASKPKTLREDGKQRGGGLLGQLVDEVYVGYAMRNCPYCKKKVMKDASKCPYCQSDILETKTCPFCGEKIRSEAKICRFCNRDIPQEELVSEGTMTSRCGICGKLFPSADIEIYKRKTVCPSCYSLKYTKSL
jgi:predicted amidophosphoribosyltransferase